MTSMDWVDKHEKSMADESSKDYFKIKEGDNRLQLLSHCAPYALRWNGSQYLPADESEQGISLKGVCWVLQDNEIKLATLPYTVVKAIKALMDDPDYSFDEFPMPRPINIKAKGAGKKEVEYSVIPGPKETPVDKKILAELAKKPSPEDMVDKMRSKKQTPKQEEKETEDTGKVEYPEESINPEDIPF